jgi:Na+-translocating ferredoxin:NAD+ oxidoreductase subunit B
MTHSITDKCNGCGSCVTVCPIGAITGEKKKKHSINRDICINCEACGAICVFKAVVDFSGHARGHIKRSQWPKPSIDLEKCYSCDNCVSICPAHVLEMRVVERGELNKKNRMAEYPVLMNSKGCISCSWCSDACNFYAITMKVTQS